MKKIVNVLLIAALAINITSSAMVYAYSDNNWDLSEEQMIDYEYSNAEVETELAALVENTKNLKNGYDMESARNVIAILKSTVEKITKEDYAVQYELFESRSGTEDSYDYMYSEVAWIERNIVDMTIKNLSGSSLSEMITFICNEYYHIAIIEMQNGVVIPASMNVLANLDDIMEYIPEDCRELVEYTYALAKGVAGDYTGENAPEDIVVSEEFVKEQQEQLSPESVNDNIPVFIEQETEYVTDFSETMGSDNAVIENDLSQSYELADKEAADAYITSLNNHDSQAVLRETEYKILSIYYTSDKTAEKPVWVDSKITLNENEEIEFEDFVSVLNVIGKHVDDTYFFEDTDMVMFIAEGKPLILNEIETISKEEIEMLFDSYEKVGLKVSLKQDETETGKKALSDKIESGEMNEISVNGNRLILTNKPILTKNILQLPVLQVAEGLGYKVSINGKTVTLTYEEKAQATALNENTEETIADENAINKIEMILTVNSNHYTINGQKNSFKTPVTEKDGVIYAEFDKLASKIGYSYSYNADTGVIEFNKFS